MTNPQKNRGDRAEREAAVLLTDLLGYPITRSLGAGRAQDRGDLHGVPDTTIQVCDWADVRAAAVQKPRGVELQRQHSGTTFAATLVRFRGGIWRVVLSPEQWATYVSESLQ